MIAPMLIVQLLVILFALVGLGMLLVSLLGSGIDDDVRGGLFLIGAIVALMATLALYGMADNDGPACNLSPSSLVERAP